MKQKSDLRILLYTMLGAAGLPLLIALIIHLASSGSRPDSNNTSTVDSAKLLSAIASKHIKTDSPTFTPNDHSDFTPTISADSQIKLMQARKKPSSTRNYSFEGMIGKPWTYYKVRGSQLQELTLNDAEFKEESDKWDKFTLSIRDINIICKPDTAYVTITDSVGKDRHYIMFKVASGNYLQTYPGRMILKPTTPLVCELFFIINDDAASVTNMDYQEKFKQ